MSRSVPSPPGPFALCQLWYRLAEIRSSVRQIASGRYGVASGVVGFRMSWSE
jgi:hypothetical protein